MSNFADMLQENSDSDEEPALENWVKIQQSTFSNWMNDKLRVHDLEVRNLRKDLKDGVRLCKLMEVLKGGKIGRIVQKKKIHEAEASSNLALALQAMAQDKVRLVNIGPEDIKGGNVKLILGLVWTLVRRYQIGSQGRLPPKKLMLSWCNAVLHPHMEVHNFGSDWNDGVALHGILEFCRPGLCPGWFNLSAGDWTSNCANALHLAESEFSIPHVITAENMSSRDLDELSGMTYLSYFLADGTPGYKATLDFVKLQISPIPVDNFDKDWNNGYILSALVKSLGGRVPGWPNIDTSDWTDANQRAMDVSQIQLNIQPVLPAKEMTKGDVDHLGVMAYAAWHQMKTKRLNNNGVTNHEPPPPVVVAPPPPVLPAREATPPPPVSPPPKEDVRPPSLQYAPPPPPATAPPEEEPSPEPSPELPRRGTTVIHTETMNRKSVTFAEAPVVQVAVPENWRNMATCTFEVDTSPMSEEGPGPIRAIADSPFGRQAPLAQSQVDEYLYHLSFTPEKKGQWIITLFYKERETKGSPYPVNVYEPSEAQIHRTTDTGYLDEPFNFDVDLTQVGLSDMDVFVVADGERVDHSMMQAESGAPKYRVTFTPKQKGVHNICVFSGGDDVGGSPFKIRVEQRDVPTTPTEEPSNPLRDSAVLSSLSALDEAINGVTPGAPASSVRASGHGLFDALIDKQSQFELDTQSDPDKKLSVSIKGASGSEVDYRVDYLPGEQLRVSYTPIESGVHTLDITYDGSPITGSPYHPNVKEGKVVIRDLELEVQSGAASSFKIDASEVKKGTLEIDSDLPIHKYDKLGHNVYQVTFIPMKVGRHDLVIKYDGRVVVGCPFEIDVK